jgi:TatD DNase family protein
MFFFNFHHHQSSISEGIYNYFLEDSFPEGNFSVGIHPKDLDENWEIKFTEIQKISQHTNCVAIGECGLDALVPTSETLQKQALEAQINWANEIQKPVIIHCVRRFQEIISFKEKAKTPLIIHGFNKKKEVADMLLKHGFYLSFGKSVLHNLSLQNVISTFPLEKMFLETDNDATEIELIYEKVAEIKDISILHLKEKINQNIKAIGIKNNAFH